MAEAVAALHTASPDEARSIVEGLRADVELLARITAEPVKPRQ
jgi:ABC-type sulfate transport system substrate-binding protein